MEVAEQKEVMLTAISKREIDPAKNTIPMMVCLDRVLIEEIPREDTVLNGIHRPASVKSEADDANAMGVVRNIGDGTPEYPVFVKKGETVYFHKSVSVEIIFNGKFYHIVRCSDIMTIL